MSDIHNKAVVSRSKLNDSVWPSPLGGEFQILSHFHLGSIQPNDVSGSKGAIVSSLVVVVL